MNQLQPDEVIQRYLLGLSSEAECDEVERYYLIETDGYERLGAAEDELVEDYLDGRLDPEERRGFEHHFLNATQRRQKLDFARALRTVVLRIPAQTRGEVAPSRRVRWFQVPAFGWMQWGAAATLAVALLGCGLLLLQNRHLSKAALVAHAEKQILTAQNDGLRRELQASAPRPSSLPLVPSDLRVISAALSPGLTRSGAGAVPLISIPAQADLGRFKLELFTNDYRSYRALVRLVKGKELLSESQLHPSSGREVVLLVPTELLRSGDYQILLSGETADGNYEPAATYSFRIVR